MTDLLLFSLPDFVMHQFEAHKATIILIVIGMVAGLLSQLLLPGRGFGMLATIAIGMAGAWLGHKYIRQHLKFIEDPLFKTIAAATLGAMALSLVINIIRGGKDKDLTHWRDR